MSEMSDCLLFCWSRSDMGSGDYGLFSVSFTLKVYRLYFCCHGNLNHFSR